MPRKTKKAEPPRPPEPFTASVETFRQVGSWELGSLTWPKPGCGNGNVSVRKYRLTVELIDESVEVIHARLRDLWEETDNHHHWGPLQHEALRYGLELDGKDFGKRRKR